MYMLFHPFVSPCVGVEWRVRWVANRIPANEGRECFRTAAQCRVYAACTSPARMFTARLNLSTESSRGHVPIPTLVWKHSFSEAALHSQN